MNQPRVRGRRIRLPAAFISELGRLLDFDLGEMTEICQYCNAKHWIGELPSECTLTNRYWSSCCKAGKVKIDLLSKPPAYIKDLYNDLLSAQAKEFRDNIRQYNSMFAFTSLRCEIHTNDMNNMPFMIHGQMHHVQGPLSSEPGRDAAFAQLYIYDPRDAINMRHSRNDNLS